jgi:hypothetical protein
MARWCPTRRARVAFLFNLLLFCMRVFRPDGRLQSDFTFVAQRYGSSLFLSAMPDFVSNYAGVTI